MINRTEEEIKSGWSLPRAPLVSICCITYNHEKFITEAIDSFLMQITTFPFEIIIGEDCSTDETMGIIKNYQSRYPNLIRIIASDTNIGMQKNFIRTLEACTGKYIALCEGDDYWTDPLKLQKQIDFLDRNKEYVITYTSAEAFNEQGSVNNFIGGTLKDLESIELQKAASINTLTVCFKNVLQALPPEFICSKFGDLFLWSLLGAYGKGKYLQDVLPSKYRIHDGGVFSKKSERQKFEMNFQTSFALYSYYKRINHTVLSNYFLNQLMIYSLYLHNISYHIKLILKYTIIRILTILNNIISLSNKKP
jgi:glycosyltransferase involved in cell wall biosynthesis